MMVRDGDAGSSSNYTAIRGVLKGVGRKVQVYVAAEDLEQVSASLVQDLIVTFDDRIYPLTARHAGPAATSMAMAGSRSCCRAGSIIWEAAEYPVDGFVRVADLDPAFRPPFGNQCDMMYLNTSLKARPPSPDGRRS